MTDFLFIHIPKSAGQSIKKALSPFNSRCSQRCTISASEHIKRIGLKKFRSLYSFAFVRNPWDRQVSFYEFIRKTLSEIGRLGGII